MPANRLTFAIRVGCDVDPVDASRSLSQFLDDLFSRGNGFVFRDESLVDVNTQLALGQISDVPHRRDNFEVSPEVLVDGLRLGRRFHDNQCLWHIFILV